MVLAMSTANFIFTETNTSLWPCIHSGVYNQSISSKISCITLRLAASLILCISIICFTLNIRFLMRQRQNALVLSLFISSFAVLLVSVPSVLTQLFTCRRLCIPIFCRLEGLVSYGSGCVCMLVLMSLSVHRYLSLNRYKMSPSYKYSALSCWIFSISWTLPPSFEYFNSYVPEGLGFHCSLNWKDSSQLSHLYVLFSFIFIYFIPLIVLFIVNIRVHIIVHTIYSLHSHSISDPRHLFQQTSSFFRSSLSTKRRDILGTIDNNSQCRSLVDGWHIRAARERRRLRLEHRFIRAIILLVGAYVFAWTPYAIIALLQLFHIQTIFHFRIIITLSALIAKVSTIIAPLAYVSTINFRRFKMILINSNKKMVNI